MIGCIDFFAKTPDSHSPMDGQTRFDRRFPIGAEFNAHDETTSFRLWAPDVERVDVVLEDRNAVIPLERERDGYFSTVLREAPPGSRYRFRLDNEQGYGFPDPVSRFQPIGPHGPSLVIDPNAFRWTDDDWRGVSQTQQIIYEMHVGTFTQEGSWSAAKAQLAPLKELGVTILEIMPIAEFPGKFNWGYDGVCLFAPAHVYGTPDELRDFINEAHRLKLGVILDVVYNHLGPDGNYLGKYAAGYFTDRYKNDWGAAINFDGEHSAPVREFFLTNAAYWIAEFHFDGLRLDATQDIFDASGKHILSEIGETVRAAAGGRSTYIVCENEPQNCRLIRPASHRGYNLDALWNDDFHHSSIVAATGKREAYYTDYLGHADEFVAAAKWNFLYQGQYYLWQKKRRGTPAIGTPAHRFVHYLENHDQVANSGQGLRLHQRTSPGIFRSLTAMLLLFPQTPLLFQGQEFRSSKHFIFFADHNKELAALVKKGRQEFLSQFPSLSSEEAQQSIDDPASAASFESCKLDHGERKSHEHSYKLHADLIRLRTNDPVFSAPEPRVDGAALSREAFVLRYFDSSHGDRLLIVNLGAEFVYSPAPLALLAPPLDSPWEMIWSSEDLSYGGAGTPLIDLMDAISIPAQCAIVFAAVYATGED